MAYWAPLLEHHSGLLVVEGAGMKDCESAQEARENIQSALERVGRDPMAQHLGIEVLEVGEAWTRTRYRPREEHLTALKMVQGGAIFAQADHAIALAASTLGGTVVTIEVKINFLERAGAGDTLVAEARPVDIKRKISLWEVMVRDQNQRRVAVCHGLAYHAREKVYTQS